MTVPVVPTESTTDYLSATRAAAARHLYEQEVALHDAEHTGVDEWVRMALIRLHDAVVEYEVACAVCAAASARLVSQ